MKSLIGIFFLKELGKYFNGRGFQIFGGCLKKYRKLVGYTCNLTLVRCSLSQTMGLSQSDLDTEG